MRRGARRIPWLLALACTLCLASQGFAQAPAKIRVATAPLLLDCNDQVCFRFLINGYDSADRPVALRDDANFKVFENGTEHSVFFKASIPIEARAENTANAQARFTFLVVDTSGSMREPVIGGKQTKFEAARAAIAEHFVSKMQQGIDRIAIAEFNSVRVRDRIGEARYRSSQAEVLDDLNRLQPLARGNTALYSAVDFALDRLDEARASAETGRQVEVLLVVFTDGMNDVHPDRGDDPGLLAGPTGMARVLERAATKAKELPLRIVTVGLEGQRTFDQEALRRLAFPQGQNTYFSASNPADLARVFSVLSAEKANRMFLTVGPVRPRREELAGRPIDFTVTLESLTASSRYEPPPIGPPAKGPQLTQLERAALDGLRTGGGDPPLPWPSLVLRLMVLAAYSLVLAVLWFGVPRLVWPDRYAPAPAAAAHSGSAGPRRATRPTGGAPKPAAGDVTVITKPGGQGSPAIRRPAPPAQRPRPEEPSGPAPVRRPARPAEGAAPPAGPPSPRQHVRPRPPDDDIDDATVFIPGKKPRE